MAGGYKIYTRYGFVYSSYINILGIYSYNPRCISTFRLIVNYHEVNNLEEFQMNISYLYEPHLSMKFKF